MNKISLKVGKWDKVVDYSQLKPTHIANRHFEYIKHSKELKTKTESSLYTEVKMIHYLFNFLMIKNISNLSLFSYATLQEFYAFLKTTTSKSGDPLTQSSQRMAYTFFKNFSKWLYEYYPDEAPPFSIFMKSNFKRNNENIKTTYFSDSVLKQIRKAINSEDDIYTKTYVIISLYYGLRSSDIIALEDNCLSMSDKDGKYDLHYVDHKQNERITIPAIASPVARAISALIRHTDTYRKQSKLNNIFLYVQSTGLINILDSYQKTRLDEFVKKHNITDDSGRLIKISSHMFRRTLATNLQSSGAPIETTQSILNHKHKRTTAKYYIKTKDEDYINQITSTLEHMQIIASTQDIAIIQEDVDFQNALRLPDGYCTNKAMAIDSDYMCDTFQKRGNCYGCTKMVTTPDFLPYFKNLVKEKEQELETKSIYGSNIIQHIEFEKDLIEMLIEKLEKYGEIQ
ncbi:tyrosine-type recombinase/integrase [Sulfuricurvum sp.]|uniref:tyrosine-type recombinase/integrase n=1 Tax=Sulfuricurvum sp. TaxID=2025608 RepID=UPI003BB76C02